MMSKISHRCGEKKYLPTTLATTAYAQKTPVAAHCEFQQGRIAFSKQNAAKIENNTIGNIPTALRKAVHFVQCDEPFRL
jgi:hypothetical protein